MTAEIIAIGTELTSGAKLDTNSQWLSLQLADLGIPVLFHTTVADDLVANVEAVRIASERVDLILLTGGLGPTKDDLTRQVLAKIANVELVLDEKALAHLEGFFRSRGRTMPKSNEIQAHFPDGASLLENPVGTAPGIWMVLTRSDGTSVTIAAFPGVPSEMHRMFTEQVRPKLSGSQQIIRRARINCFGIGESATEELLGDLTARGRDPEVGITAHEATITLRIIATGNDDSECEMKISAVSKEIHERLPDYVFGVEDDELEDIVIRKLIASNTTLSTIELSTTGQLASRLAQVPGADQCYRGGHVATEESASITDMANNLRTRTQSTYCLGIGAESVEKTPDGHRLSTIPIVLITPSETITQVLEWTGNPAITRSRTTKTALNWLRQQLIFSSAESRKRPGFHGR